MGKRKRRPRLQVRKTAGTDWRKKLHPVFFRGAEFDKKVKKLLASSKEIEREEGQRLAVNPPKEILEGAPPIYESTDPAVQARSNAVLAIYGAHPSQKGGIIPYSQHMAGWMAWSKYRRTLEELHAGDGAYDEKSSKQLMSVMKEHERWRYGKLDPNKLRVKSDTKHFHLMLWGLDFGIETLSPSELADCFDEFCIACPDGHDAENLAKFRARLIQELEELVSKAMTDDSA